MDSQAELEEVEERIVEQLEEVRARLDQLVVNKPQHSSTIYHAAEVEELEDRIFDLELILKDVRDSLKK
jgi:hypothetical protein